MSFSLRCVLESDYDSDEASLLLVGKDKLFEVKMGNLENMSWVNHT